MCPNIVKYKKILRLVRDRLLGSRGYYLKSSTGHTRRLSELERRAEKKKMSRGKLVEFKILTKLM